MVVHKEMVARVKRTKTRPGLSRSLTIRLPNDLYDRLEAYGERLGAEMPGVDLTISDVVRSLLEQSLLERRRADRANRRNDEEAQKLVEELRDRGIVEPKEEEGI
jgi:hypothetical protein